MIDKELLKDIGFERATPHNCGETWKYMGAFWVHYGPFDSDFTEDWDSINGERCTRTEFFKRFLDCVINDCLTNSL